MSLCSRGSPHRQHQPAESGQKCHLPPGQIQREIWATSQTSQFLKICLEVHVFGVCRRPVLSSASAEACAGVPRSSRFRSGRLRRLPSAWGPTHCRSSEEHWPQLLTAAPSPLPSPFPGPEGHSTPPTSRLFSLHYSLPLTVCIKTRAVGAHAIFTTCLCEMKIIRLGVRGLVGGCVCVFFGLFSTMNS